MGHEKESKLWLNHARKIVKQINSYRDIMIHLSEEELKAKTEDFKVRYRMGEKLDALLPESFAVVREVSKRVLGMEHYDVQLIGGIALHEGKIAEMKTGEGKTMVAVLPAYLNALTGKGVHVVTVNDYLAARDAELMGKVYQYLGLTVGVVLSTTSKEKKKIAYTCDITYVINSELGFDYLRDNMAEKTDDVVQRGLNYAVIDEVDSILIDEARTPLIISGGGKDASKLYLMCDYLAKQMRKGESNAEFNKMDAMIGILPEESGDFIVHEKDKNITLTTAGVQMIEAFFGLENYSDPRNLSIQHGMDIAMRANYVLKHDYDYIVRNNEILIVDTFTGRVLPGRRFSDGLHQAIEAKEGVKIQPENKTIATTTYQNFFNKYAKICGMTGTAYSERKEFKRTYHLDTVVIPTNKPIRRIDRPDVIYLTREGKYHGVLEEVKKTLSKGQPVLIGTASVKTSEELSAVLTEAGIQHQVLNAKQDEHEAEIISKAGIHGTVTIATNMAGRGTDIILDQEATEAGGLKVIGTERHSSLRIDNQLRGRSGRQGDPGESVFYLSMDDDLIRFFAKDRFQHLADSGLYPTDQPLSGRVFQSAVIQAQKKVELNHFGARKTVLDYDNVKDHQREMVYAERRKVLAGEDVSSEIQLCFSRFIDHLVETNTEKKADLDKILSEYERTVGFQPDIDVGKQKHKKTLKRLLLQDLQNRYHDQAEAAGESIRDIERFAILKCIDTAWTEQLSALDFLQQDIWYLGYAQIDAKAAYALEAFKLYDLMRFNIYRMVTYACFHYRKVQERPKKELDIRKEGV